MIIGEKIKLVPIERQDLSILIEWRNKKIILDQIFSYLPLNLDKQLMWWESYNYDLSRECRFMIKEIDTSRSVGTIGFTDIDFKNQKAEITIIIGEEDRWGMGYGTEALCLLTKWGFEELNLRKIVAEVIETNKRSRDLFVKNGFNLEGVLVEDVFKNGKYRDVHIYALFRN